jgi:hypothetical protein
LYPFYALTLNRDPESGGISTSCQKERINIDENGKESQRDDNPAPNPVQYMQCAALIAKVMISEDGKFTQSEIELANELLAHSWNNNVTDFLHVVAGIAHSSLDVHDESLAALTFQFDRQQD